MVMRIAIMVSLVAVISGCASKFDGEWIEQAPQGASEFGKTGERRIAVAFCPPSLVRVGMVAPKLEVVDRKTVQESGYFLFDGWQRAQVGSVVAQVEGDELITYTGSKERRFTRVKGKSIFPPRLVLLPWG